MDKLNPARAGLWLGIAWAAMEAGAQALSPGWPLWVLTAEVLVSGLLWLGLSVALAQILRALGADAPRNHAPLLLGCFVAAGANLLIHPYLLAGVKILTPKGFAFSCLFTATLIALPWLGSRLWRRQPSPPVARPSSTRNSGNWPAGLWVLAALLMAIVFGVGRIQLSAWPAGMGRVAAGWALCAVSSLVCLGLTPFTRPRGLWGPLPAGALILLLAWPIPRFIRGHQAPLPLATASPSATPVILISLDTTRPDHLSHFGYGKPTSPKLDAFLEKCVVFENAYATSSWTLPSHASVFTGLYPVSHGAHYPAGAPTGAVPGALDPRLPTLADIFRERGYRTGAVSANRLAVIPELGLDKGFQQVQTGLRAGTRPMPVNLVRALSRLFRRTWLLRFARQHWDAREVTDRALAWTARYGESPFFLFVNYIDPHSPYAPPAPLPGDPGSGGGLDRLRWSWAKPAPKSAMGAANYDAEIRHMDNHLGRFLTGLDASGILDRAIVVIFSDHGESFGEVGVWGHDREVHEALLRALIAVRYPGGRHAGADSTLVNLADIPRLIGIAETGEAPAAVLGNRRDPWVAGEKYMTTHQMRENKRFQRPARLTAARWGRFKLVNSPDEARLFDVRVDPEETHDLASIYPDTVRVLREFVTGWEATQTRAQPVAARGEKSALEVLRGLGYVQ